MLAQVTVPAKAGHAETLSRCWVSPDSGCLPFLLLPDFHSLVSISCCTPSFVSKTSEHAQARSLCKEWGICSSCWINSYLPFCKSPLSLVLNMTVHYTTSTDLNRKPACSDFTTICLCQANVAEKELAEHCSGTCINHKTGTCNKLLVRVLCWRIPKLLFAFPLSKTRKVSRGWKVKQISIFRITALFTTSQLTPLNS